MTKELTNFDGSLETRHLSHQDFRVLKETIWPSASDDRSVLLAYDYCRARGLDPFKRQVHIIPRWDKKAGKLVDTVVPGIAELRTTAMRTRAYAGKDTTEYGPDVVLQLGAMEVTVPEWASVAVWRMNGGTKTRFCGDRVYFAESYAPISRKDAAPNDVWSKRPRGQLSKCAEAAALRCAFPEEIGGEHSAEEMTGHWSSLPEKAERGRVIDDGLTRTEQIKSLIEGPEIDDMEPAGDVVEIGDADADDKPETKPWP